MNDASARLPPALELRNVARAYDQGAKHLEIFSGVNFSLEIGEIVALVGPSGSGKSSLLHIAGLLERPTSGQVLFAATKAATTRTT